MLGVPPLSGRFFAAGRGQNRQRARGPPRATACGNGASAATLTLWDSPITLQGQPYTVVGVMPRWLPVRAVLGHQGRAVGASRSGPRGPPAAKLNSLRAFARLKPGVTLEQARSEMATITARLEQQFPGTNRNVTVQLAEGQSRWRCSPGAARAVGGGGLRTAYRLRQRRAPADGSRRSPAARDCSAGRSRGRALADRAASSLRRAYCWRSSAAAPACCSRSGAFACCSLWCRRRCLASASISLDAPVLLFTAAISVLTGIIFGVVPALQASGVQLA